MLGGIGQSGTAGESQERKRLSDRQTTMSEKLTDIQCRALLRGEVQKLQTSGMDYDTAFQTAFESHPEWRAVEPLGDQNRQRRTGAQMVNDGAAITNAELNRRIQELVNAYMAANPNVGYDAAFRRVLSDPRNKELVQGMHLPQRAFKPIQTNRGAGVNTPPSHYRPYSGKGSAGEYSTGSPPERAAKAGQ